VNLLIKHRLSDRFVDSFLIAMVIVSLAGLAYQFIVR
jgi:hypothetical protein